MTFRRDGGRASVRNSPAKICRYPMFRPLPETRVAASLSIMVSTWLSRPKNRCCSLSWNGRSPGKGLARRAADCRGCTHAWAFPATVLRNSVEGSFGEACPDN